MVLATVVLGDDGLWSWSFPFTDAETCDETDYACMVSCEAYGDRSAAQAALEATAKDLGYVRDTIWNIAGRVADGYFRLTQ